MNKFIILFCCLISFALQTNAATLYLNKTTITQSKKGTKLIFTLSGRTSLHYFQMAKPPRIVIDLQHITPRGKINSSITKNSQIKKIRTGIHPKKFRLVIELEKKSQFKTYWLLPKKDKYDRLVLTFSTKNDKKLIPPLPKMTHKKEKIQTHKKAHASNKPTLTLSKNHTKPIIVIIDPGHGGNDSGTISKQGVYEKNVVLAIAKDVEKAFKHYPNFNVKLTRTGDYYIPLRGRLEIARKYHANMFVSIHADAFKNPHEQGVSVFALSKHGATSEAARWLAHEENKSELKYDKLGDIELSDKSRVLRYTLIHLAQGATINMSLHIGHAIIDQLTNITKIHNPDVEQAAFVVLKSPDIPSLLIETGFLSNPTEEKKLQSATHRQAIAQAIVKGIMNYFNQHPGIIKS